MSTSREPAPLPPPEPEAAPTLRDLVLRAISPASRTRADVRRDLARHFRPSGVPRVPNVHDDSGDLDALLDLVTDELERRGIGGDR